MRKTIYALLLRLPVKLGAAAFSIGGFVGSVWPDKVRNALDGGVTTETIRAIGIMLLVLGIIYFAALWLLKPSSSSGSLGSPSASHGPNSPIVGGDGNAIAFGDGARAMAGDNYFKGNFNEGTIHGDQNYYDRLPPRSVPLDAFSGSALGLQARAFIRPAESEHERFQFAESLVSSLNAAGIASSVQGGYGNAGHSFAGVIVSAAPNADAQALANRVAAAIQNAGLSVSLGEPMSAWGDDVAILLYIGANA